MRAPGLEKLVTASGLHHPRQWGEEMVNALKKELIF